jgi:FAD binding domain
MIWSRAVAESDEPVLLVGGGPAGLAASLLLSGHGVRSGWWSGIPGASVHPEARGLDVRALEWFGVWGWGRRGVPLRQRLTGRPAWFGTDAGGPGAPAQA